MTLGEFALLLDADPKWIQNAAATLRPPLRYTLAAAQRLAVARALIDALQMPMPTAYALAAGVLQRFDRSSEPVRITDPTGRVTVDIDVRRILADISVGLSRLRTGHGPRLRGRPSYRGRALRDPIATARRYGIDITLLQSALGRSPAERLQALDENAAALDALRARR